MAKGLSSFPHNLYAIQSKMDKIGANWKHQFKRGEAVWLLNKPKREILGPYTFAYYSPASAIVIIPNWQFGNNTRRIEFLKDQVMFQTEKEALVELTALKLIDYVQACNRCDMLLDELEKIAEPKIVACIKQVRLDQLKRNTKDGKEN